MAGASDKHWAEQERPPKIPPQIFAEYKRCHYKSQYVPMQDGVRIAVDTQLPGAVDPAGGAKLPTVLFQTRYHRGMKLRWPLKRITNGRPVDLLNMEVKSYLLAEGYATVTIDVRGTGASFGRWSMAWPPAERQDSVEIIDWIIRQPWSNGQVVLIGQSYDGTAALFTVAQQHPAIKGCTALYAFWDLYADISVPGGVAMNSFTRSWSDYCRAMDRNSYSGLPFPVSKIMNTVSKGCVPVVDYVQHGDSSSPLPVHLDGSAVASAGMPDGPFNSAAEADASAQGSQMQPNAAQTSSSTCPSIPSGCRACPATNGAQVAPSNERGLHAARPASTAEGVAAAASAGPQAASCDDGQVPVESKGSPTAPSKPGDHVHGWRVQHLPRKLRKAAKQRGKMLLAHAIASHDSWNGAEDSRVLRFTDQIAPQAGVPVTAASLCALADQLAAANVPLLLISGWLDVTAAAAIHTFVHSAKAPGSQLILGPWSHGGWCDNRPGHYPLKGRTAFYQARVVVDFCNECCGRPVAPRHITAHTAGTADTAANDLEAHSMELLQQAYLDRGARTDSTHDSPHPPSGGSSSSSGEPAAALGSARQAAGAGDVAALSVAANGGCKGHDSDRQADKAPAAHGAAQPQQRGVDAASSGCGASVEAANGAEQPQQGSSAGAAPVHYFVMGHGAHWEASRTWPPAGVCHKAWYLGGSPAAPSPAGSAVECASPAQVPAAGQPGKQAENASISGACEHTEAQTLAEGQADVAGMLSSSGSGVASWRWEHSVEPWKHIKGRTRYDAMSRLMDPIRYTGLRAAGHLTFTSPPLEAPLEVVGWVGLDLWLASSDSDADIFAYVQDVRPETGKARYISEGVFRASHRKEYDAAPAGNPRAKSNLPGVPFRSFEEQDAQPLVPGQVTRVHFQMLPTAYTFPKGHCIRLSVSGSDAKHFHMDHAGPRTLWIHSGPATPSCLHLPISTKH